MIRFSNCSNMMSIPDPFETIAYPTLKKLGMEDPDRRIPFLPVVTKPNVPIGMAFIGLNAYCGNDFREAVKQPNFSAWCQDRYNPRLKIVMSNYEPIFNPSRAAYFTNYFKVVLPEDKFKSSADAMATLNDNSLKTTFDRSLQLEIGRLSGQGCKVFVSFGNDSFNSVRDALNLVNIRSVGKSGRVYEAQSQSGMIYIVNEKHFSRYEKAVTASIISDISQLV